MDHSFVLKRIFLFCKLVIEVSFALPVAKFFEIQLKWWHASLQLIHILYMVIAGWLGKFGTYQWKDRTVK